MRNNAYDGAMVAAVETATSLRHTLHRFPELSGHESETAGRVAEALAIGGIPTTRNLGGLHGLMCTIHGHKDGPCWALRADMDALPIHEERECAYTSTYPGVMHACGHDGHTATLVGVALLLNQMRDQFSGSVRCLFQPAEETVSGAKSVIEGGGLEGVDYIVMSHGWPDLAVGTIGVRYGPAMASSDSFEILITGVGAHAAYPHMAKDPIFAGTSIVVALQQLVSRNVNPVDSAVVSITMFHAGTARNIIPGEAVLQGTLRTLKPGTRALLMARLDEVVCSVASGCGVSAKVTWKIGTPPVLNNRCVVDRIASVASSSAVGASVQWLDEPTMGAEDFSHYLACVPGAMLRLGTECPYHLHTPKYDFGDPALAVGIRLLSEIAMSGGVPELAR